MRPVGADDTVSWKLVVVVACPSFTAIVMVATPVWLPAGVTVTVRLAPAPPKVMLALGTSVVLDELPLTVRLAAGVSASPMVKVRGATATAADVVWFAMVLTGGGSFTAVTVSWKLEEAVAWPSLTVRVMVATPD